jgi:hypothetical protein
MAVLVKAGGKCDKNKKTFNALVSDVGMVIIYDETRTPSMLTALNPDIELQVLAKPPVPGAGMFAYVPDGSEPSIAIPVVFNMEYYTAQTLLQKMGAGPVTVTASVIIDARDVKNDNIIAQTKWGDQNKACRFFCTFALGSDFRA